MDALPSLVSDKGKTVFSRQGCIYNRASLPKRAVRGNRFRFGAAILSLETRVREHPHDICLCGVKTAPVVQVFPRRDENFCQFASV
jgi:hypothetical protein